MRVSRIILFFIHLHKTLAWDGCAQGHAWRCGDKCILVISGSEAECKCGGDIFNHTAHMWCCNDTPCRGRGHMVEDTWLGQNNKERRLIGAECNGTALKLEQACNQTCNKYEDFLNIWDPVWVHLDSFGPFQTKMIFFAPNGQNRVLQRCFRAKYQFLFEMVQKGPDGPKRVPNVQKDLG